MLETISRHFIRGLLAVFTTVVLLLLQSAFWSGAVSVWMRIAVVIVASIAYFRPQKGLLLLAAIVPLGQVGSRTLNSDMRGAEALALAFLAGALVRGWTLREFRSFPSTRVETAAVVFGLIVAASCAEQLWLLQVQTSQAWPFVQSVLTYASHHYLASYREFDTIFSAMLLLEGMALLAYTLKYARQSPAFAHRIVVALIIGAVIPTVFTVHQVMSELFDANDLRTAITEILLGLRWGPHIGDRNAAGSFFAMGLFIAFGMALTNPRYRILWATGGCALALTTIMTGSRTAIAAVMLVTICLAAAATIGRVIGVLKAGAIAAAVSAASAVALWHYLPREYFGHGATLAMDVRRLFLHTTWRMLTSNPLFGVGVGQYASSSAHYSAPELLNYYVSENAHNNFAQIAGEVGAVGAAAFMAVLVCALWYRGGRRDSNHATTLPLIAGITAFIVSWLGGHPLLVPEVAYPFWIALGVAAAALAPDPVPNGPAGVIIMAVCGVLIVSIPYRVASKEHLANTVSSVHEHPARRFAERQLLKEDRPSVRKFH